MRNQEGGEFIIKNPIYYLSFIQYASITKLETKHKLQISWNSEMSLVTPVYTSKAHFIECENHVMGWEMSL